MNYTQTKDLCVSTPLVFIVLIFFVNIFYPIPTEFVIFCGLGVGVGNFLVNKFFIPKE